MNQPSLGKVKNERYFAPVWGLSSALPKLLPLGLKIEDSIGSDGEGTPVLSVSFTDDFGGTYSIYGWQTPSLLMSAQHPEVDVNEQILEIYRGDLLGLFPGTQVLHREPVEDILGGSQFAVFRIPRGSSYEVMRGKEEGWRREDSVRGFLALHQGDVALVVGVQQESPEAQSEEANAEEQWRSLRTDVLEFATTLSFQ